MEPVPEGAAAEDQPGCEAVCALTCGAAAADPPDPEAGFAASGPSGCCSGRKDAPSTADREAPSVRHRGPVSYTQRQAGTRAGVHPRCALERAGSGETGRQGAELVEDLDDLVVGAGLGKEFSGGGERLARARGRAEAGVRVWLQERGHDLPQGVGNALRGSRRAVRGEVLDEGLGVRLGAFQEVQRGQSHGEQVGGEVRFSAHHLLGREIAGRPHHEVGLRQARFAQPHRDAEVGQPQPGPVRARGFQENVGGLDVAVDDAFRVHRVETGEELVEQRADEGGRQGAVVADEVDQRAAGDQVHGEQDLVVVGGPAGRCEHMRVVDPQRLFTDEAQQRVRVALLQNLGGDIPTTAVVPGAPDGTHSSASDRVGQFVPAGEDLTHGCAPPLPLR